MSKEATKKTGGLGKYDVSIKQCVRDDLPGLLRLIDDRLELVGVLEPELQLAELRRDKLLLVRLFDQKMALNAEFQTDPDAAMPERMHAYACQVYVLHRMHTFGVVIYLRPQEKEPSSRFVWSVRERPMWQYEFVTLNVSDYSAEDALATGSPLLAALSPLMQQASLKTSRCSPSERGPSGKLHPCPRLACLTRKPLRRLRPGEEGARSGASQDNPVHLLVIESALVPTTGGGATCGGPMFLELPASAQSASKSGRCAMWLASMSTNTRVFGAMCSRLG